MCVVRPEVCQRVKRDLQKDLLRSKRDVLTPLAYRAQQRYAHISNTLATQWQHIGNTLATHQQHIGNTERSSGMRSTLVYCTKFSTVSALEYLLYRVTIQRTFENFGLQLMHTLAQRTAEALSAKAAKLRCAKVSKETYKKTY